MELKNTIRFFKHPEHLQTTLGLHRPICPAFSHGNTGYSDSLSFTGTDTDHRTISKCNEHDGNCTNVPSRNRFRYHRLSVAGSGESRFNPFGTFNPADLMMNMLSDEQKEMFQMYQDLFSDASDSSKQPSENSAT